MTLDEYLRHTGRTRAEFARTIGITGQAVAYYIAGKRHPRPAIMRRIVAATEGEVRPDDFLAAVEDAA